MGVTVELINVSLFEPHPSSAPPFFLCISNMDDRPNLAELLDWVRTEKWHNLGIKLGLESSVLKEIEKQYANNGEDCRRTMFSTWLSTSNKCSRGELLQALSSRAVGENYMADEYQRSFQKRTHSAPGMYR